MESALRLAAERARAAGASRINRMCLRIGALSGVVPESLEFAFETLRQDTLAAQAVLAIESVPAACWCGECRVEFESPDLLFECPRCGALASELRRGREMDLVSVEVS
jgi:hydrogenase nickel incorporation protein HypA/HybF